MSFKKTWILGLAVAFLAGLGAPVANAENRDKEKFKRDVLKAVERLMDKKLKDFKGDLMKDMREMLARRGASERVARVRAPAAPRSPKAPAKRGVLLRRAGDGHGPRIQVEGPRHKASQKDVQVITKDGKTWVMVNEDGKVMKKVFEAGDPEMKKWLGKVGGGFHVEIPGKGHARVKVQTQAKGCPHCGQGKDKTAPWAGTFKKMFGGEGRPHFEEFEKRMKQWKEKAGENWGRWEKGKPRVLELKKGLAERLKKFQPKKGAEVLERILKEVEPKMKRSYRVLRPKRGGEVEELEREKDRLKDELEEIKRLLKKLVEETRRRR
jgi:hypothetical protein